MERAGDMAQRVRGLPCNRGPEFRSPRAGKAAGHTTPVFVISMVRQENPRKLSGKLIWCI